MAQILRELVAGVAAEHLRWRAARVLEQIEGGGPELESLAKMVSNPWLNPTATRCCARLKISKQRSPSSNRPT